VNPTTLKTSVTLSEATVPIQVCYIVPIDASSEMLTAIFEECHNRWGGRDTLIMPVVDGQIDEKYWTWAQALDPDVVYSYADLDVSMLERVDRDLMPSVVTIHRYVTDRPDLVPRHEVEALQALSVLPMLANADRLGPPRRIALVSAFMDWKRDTFVTDSFGLNPFGPGWAQAETVRKYVATIALGSRPNALGRGADEQVANPTALLDEMWNGKYVVLTMAQPSGTGYDDIFYDRESAWARTFNIIVGDTALDRIAFWNARIGVDDYQRRNIVAVRLNESHLQDQAFVATLVHFVSRWNTSTSQSGPSFATIRSSSVPNERLQSIANALGRLNVQTTVAHFDDATDCTPRGADKRGFIRQGRDQRFTESKIPLIPTQPPHLSKVGPVSSWLSNGGWTVHIALKRQGNAGFGSSLSPLPIPRRWQAVRMVVGGAIAKPTMSGNLRVTVRGDKEPQALCFTDDDAEFVVGLFTPNHYLWTTDIRAAKLPKPATIYPQISSAGRQLLGFLKRLRSLQTAYAVLGSGFWKSVFNEMAVPREVFDNEKRVELAAKLEKPIKRDGPSALATKDDFERLADVVARIAPDLKTPRAMRPYDWFVDMYRKSDECKRPRDPARTAEDIEQQIQREVEEQLRRRCLESVLVQGYAWKCRRCLHQNWSTVEALGRVVTCEVCDRQEATPANFSWNFLLDGYVAVGLRDRGLRGLVWALGDLRWQSRHSFMFSPPLDLSRDGVHLTDSDIACVVDGKFVIGEVKESGRKINDTLGKRLIEVAIAVRPDVIVLACLDAAELPTVTRQTDRMREALKGLGIEVRAMVPNGQHEGPMGFVA
jgi:hypothetical protein